MSDPAEHWNQEAASFDDAPDHGLLDPGVREAWTALLSPLLPPPPSRIADLGCGTGSLAVLLAAKGHVLTALDVSPAMIERARLKAAKANLAIGFTIGDARQPPWPAQSFDVVLCRHVLWALGDAAAVLEQWFRILKPDGRLLLVEGRWWTGAGLSAEAVVEALAAGGHSAAVTPLRDPALWGREISDERYLIVSDQGQSGAKPSAPKRSCG